MYEVIKVCNNPIIPSQISLNKEMYLFILVILLQPTITHNADSNSTNTPRFHTQETLILKPRVATLAIWKRHKKEKVLTLTGAMKKAADLNRPILSQASATRLINKHQDWR